VSEQQSAELTGTDRRGSQASREFSFTVTASPANPYKVMHYALDAYTTDAVGVMVAQGYQPMFVNTVPGGIKVTYMLTDLAP